MLSALASSAYFAKGPRADLAQLIKLRHLAGSINLFPDNKTRNHMSGGYRSIFRGRGMDFDEVRPYQPGDDVRSIDWRVTARTAKTHTKIFKEEKDRPVIIAVDQSPSLFFGSQVTYKAVMATQLAALLAWAGLQQNDKAGGIVFNHNSHRDIKPQRNKHAVLSLLKSMCEFNDLLFTSEASSQKENEIQHSFSNMLDKLRHIAKPGSAIFIISDFLHYDQDSERLLHLIKRHTDVYTLIVADPFEQSLPSHGNYSVTDGKNKLNFSSNDKSLVEHYKKSFQQKQASLHQSFKKLGIAYTTVWTNDDPLKAIRYLIGN